MSKASQLTVHICCKSQQAWRCCLPLFTGSMCSRAFVVWGTWDLCLGYKRDACCAQHVRWQTARLRALCHISSTHAAGQVVVLILLYSYTRKQWCVVFVCGERAEREVVCVVSCQVQDDAQCAVSAHWRGSVCSVKLRKILVCMHPVGVRYYAQPFDIYRGLQQMRQPLSQTELNTGTSTYRLFCILVPSSLAGVALTKTVVWQASPQWRVHCFTCMHSLPYLLQQPGSMFVGIESLGV